MHLTDRICIRTPIFPPPLATMKNFTSAATALLLLACSACRVTPDATQRYAENGTRAVEDVSGAIIAAARATPGVDPAPLDKFQEQFDARTLVRESQFAEARKEIEEQKRRLDAIIESVSAVAGLVGAPATGGLGALVSTLLGNMKSSAEGASTDVNALRIELDSAKTRLESVESAVDCCSESSVRLAALEQFRLKIESSKEWQDKQVMELETRLKNLDETKLKAVQDSVLAEAKKSGALENEKLRAEVVAEIATVGAEMGMTDEKIKSLQEDAGTDLYGLLGAGGGAGLLGLIALLRTMGKSRGQKEIDELYDALNKLSVDVARTTGASGGSSPANREQSASSK